MHLIYTRFFHKACRDLGITKGNEPMLKLRNQGMVLGEDQQKMSKSRGNVVDPDALVARYGADTVRAYLMFFARWEMGAPWDSKGIEGSARWVRRVWTMFLEKADKMNCADAETLRTLRRKVHQTIKAVTRDMEAFQFNTVVSGLMELLNDLGKAKAAGAMGSKEWDEAADIYLRLMAPVAPHITEEIWEQLGKPYSIHTQLWPEADEAAAKDDVVTYVVQVNGKLRDRVDLPASVSDEDAKAEVLARPAVIAALEGKEPKKVIIVPKKLINIVK